MKCAKCGCECERSVQRVGGQGFARRYNPNRYCKECYEKLIGQDRK